jgi:hypothetical protein
MLPILASANVLAVYPLITFISKGDATWLSMEAAQLILSLSL